MPTTKPRRAPVPTTRVELNASLEAAIEEAERVGYIGAEEASRRADELLKRIDALVAAGKIKS